MVQGESGRPSELALLLLEQQLLMVHRVAISRERCKQCFITRPSNNLTDIAYGTLSGHTHFVSPHTYVIVELSSSSAVLESMKSLIFISTMVKCVHKCHKATVSLTTHVSTEKLYHAHNLCLCLHRYVCIHTMVRDKRV